MTTAESSLEDSIKDIGNLQLAIDATSNSLKPWLERSQSSDESLDMSAGLSLLLIRPQLLLASLNNLVLLTALRLQGAPEPDLVENLSFSEEVAGRSELQGAEETVQSLAGRLRVDQEIIDKVRGMESKLSYQIKKLSALAEAEEHRGKEVIERVEEDPLSFRPNMSAMMGSTDVDEARPSTSKVASEDGDGVYRPPRVAAVPYNEPGTKKRSDRRAPALLSEFADSMEGNPILESTSGLATRPVRLDQHTNSLSAKRAKELREIDEYEQANMTRLGTTKREAKRRREDEQALAMGYGISEATRGRRGRVNGLEAEMEGVLGVRRSGGVWDGVGSRLGARGGVLERGSKAKSSSLGEGPPKKGRFEKDLQSHRKKRS